jgi:(p)ppGpp synthase/HD superfamily hydrolase
MTKKIELNYDYEKHRCAMRYWLLGREWHLALKAMEMGLLHHTGERKNGNPEFSHQIFQAQYARTLPFLLHPEETLSVIFLHDIVEDHGVAVSTIHAEFGEMVGNGVDLMSDVDTQGRDKPLSAYYSMMVESPVASIAKGIDRMHNFQSMMTVFSDPKKSRYIEETRDHLLPMLKASRKKYTQQEPAYQNVKHMLLTQMELISEVISVTVPVVKK